MQLNSWSFFPPLLPHLDPRLDVSFYHPRPMGHTRLLLPRSCLPSPSLLILSLVRIPLALSFSSRIFQLGSFPSSPA